MEKIELIYLQKTHQVTEQKKLQKLISDQYEIAYQITEMSR